MNTFKVKNEKQFLDELKNFILKLNSYSPSKLYSEITETQLETLVVNAMDRMFCYSLENKFEVKNQVALDNNDKTNLVADIVVYEKNKKGESIPSFVIELKRPSVKLDDGGTKSPVNQLTQYMQILKTGFGVLTNGIEWRLYYINNSKKGPSTVHNIYTFKMCDDKQIETIDKKVLNNLSDGLAVFHADNIKNWMLQKNKSHASSEKTIFKILMEPEIIVKVQSLIKKKCEFKQTHDEVYKNTLMLLYYGLNEINKSNKSIDEINTEYVEIMKAGMKKINQAAKKKMATKQASVNSENKEETVETIELSEMDVSQQGEEEVKKVA